MQTNTLDIRNYVSNLDKNVYTIYNLPEEVVAVIFAYVSRSSASFRDNLLKLLADDELGVTSNESRKATAFSEKASKFHEKWVVGYGHSSVAEHAVAHIGIEKISRLASAELEIANSFNSFTEYSQRYQRPMRGDFYIPSKLSENPHLKEKYISFNHDAYTLYETLFTGLYSFLETETPKKEKESPRAFQMRIEKLAFEDARYVLTLATHTNLGMTGNGRALRDTLVTLLSTRYEECIELAQEMKSEIEHVIPTLLKHLKPNEYMLKAQSENLFENFKETFSQSQGPVASFLHIPDYEETLRGLHCALLTSKHGTSYEEAMNVVKAYSIEQMEDNVELLLESLRFFDNPLPQLQHITYSLSLCISEANWHQLLRHNRRTHFSYGPPTISLGYTIPPNIKKAGLSDIFCKFMEDAGKIYTEIEKWDPLTAHYVVTNAHHRQIIATCSLWELYHLINLRTSEEAQWDIRITFEQIYKKLRQEHPKLIEYAKRRA